MKKIHIVCPYIEGVATIKSYLADFGFEMVDFKSLDAALKLMELPDLIILFSGRTHEEYLKDADTLKKSVAYTRIPRIFLLPSLYQGDLGALDLADGKAIFQMPVDKLRFLAVAAKFLNRAQRRVFRILITLLPEGANIRYSGISMDFSESGLAFESSADFEKGDRLAVHFVNPRNRKRFQLSSSIVRKAKSPAGDNTFYGVKFVDLPEEKKRDLVGFITGEE